MSIKYEVLIFTVNFDRPNQSQTADGKVVHERRTLAQILEDGWEPISICEGARSYGSKWVFKRPVQCGQDQVGRLPVPERDNLPLGSQAEYSCVCSF